MQKQLDAIQEQLRVIQHGNGRPGLDQMRSTLYGDVRTGVEGLVGQMNLMDSKLEILVDGRAEDKAERKAVRRLNVAILVSLILGLALRVTDLPKILLALIH